MDIKRNFKGQLYAVGYSYGTSSAGKTYVNVLVSKNETPTTRSQFSIYCDDELATKVGIDMNNLPYPAQGERQKRVSLPSAIALFEGILATVEHSPIKINGRTLRDLTIVCTVDESPEQVASAAVQRRFDSEDARFFPVESFKEDYSTYVLPDDVGRDELTAWLSSLE